MKFSELKIHPDILEGIESMGFEEATPIQEQTIPASISGEDILGIAQTGTGKTAAFVIPAMHKILNSDRSKINVLIITPTRELAKQIDERIQGLGYFGDISSIAIYGGGDGNDFTREKTALTTGVDIVIATPGRLMSHLNLGYVNFKTLDMLILDEADRMLDMGFYEDIMRIVKHTDDSRQSLMFSATMPSKIREMTKNILKNPKVVNIGVSKPAAGVLQAAYIVFDNQKVPLILHLLKGKELNKVIVFSSTKRNVENIYRELKRNKISCRKMSSDLTQDDREQVMLDFKNEKIDLLVATDVISRGIDINDISMVINFDVPNDAEDYVHRVGRTARAAKTGMALTIVSPDEQRKFKQIEDLIEMEIHKVVIPEELGPVPPYNPGKKIHGKKKFYKKKPYKGNRSKK